MNKPSTIRRNGAGAGAGCTTSTGYAWTPPLGGYASISPRATSGAGRTVGSCNGRGAGGFAEEALYKESGYCGRAGFGVGTGTAAGNCYATGKGIG